MRFNVLSTTLWAKQKVILISLTLKDYHLQFIVSFLRLIKLSTLFSHELLAFISVSRYFWSHHPNKACLFLKGLPAKKLNLVIVILFPLRKKYISGSVNVANSVIRKSCNSKQSNDICGELPNWNKFLIWTAKYLRSASFLTFKFMIPSAILPSSSLKLPCLSVGRLECCIKKNRSADKYSRGLFSEYYVDIGKRNNMFLTSVT